MDELSELLAAKAGIGRALAENAIGIILDFLRTGLMAQDFYIQDLCRAGICIRTGELFKLCSDTIEVDRMGAIVARHRA
ncbi:MULTISPECIES: hypothetical protein [unclassified Bradyrhizobium]|uniref:hypothetical protein n=1 Tax=unclassified Bradyrhizobium TaxID=2631580 RepID=UPI002916E854|nr:MULTISPECIES: hypothetical protein [unclassified Bradyrhizobium]